MIEHRIGVFTVDTTAIKGTVDIGAAPIGQCKANDTGFICFAAVNYNYTSIAFSINYGLADERSIRIEDKGRSYTTLLPLKLMVSK